MQKITQQIDYFWIILLTSLFCLQIGALDRVFPHGSKAQAQAEMRPKKTEGQKTVHTVLMVIAPKDFRDEELFTPKKIIEKAGYRVVIASTHTQLAVGMLGGKAKPDITLDQVRVSDYTAIVFIGGSGTRTLLKNPQALALAKNFEKANKLVAAICMAPQILANAGLLKGKKATSWKGGHANLRAKGATISSKPVVKDGRTITGNGPSAATQFGKMIVQSLSQK